MPLIELKIENKGLNRIEKGRERETLTKAPGGLEEVSSMPIHQGRNLGRFKTGLDPVDESWIKAKPMHNLEEKVISNSIKGIS